jgi:hypothetical protein
LNPKDIWRGKKLRIIAASVVSYDGMFRIESHPDAAEERARFSRGLLYAVARGLFGQQARGAEAYIEVSTVLTCRRRA